MAAPAVNVVFGTAPGDPANPPAANLPHAGGTIIVDTNGVAVSLENRYYTVKHTGFDMSGAPTTARIFWQNGFEVPVVVLPDNVPGSESNQLTMNCQNADPLEAFCVHAQGPKSPMMVTFVAESGSIALVFTAGLSMDG